MDDRLQTIAEFLELDNIKNRKPNNPLIDALNRLVKERQQQSSQNHTEK